MLLGLRRWVARVTSARAFWVIYPDGYIPKGRTTHKHASSRVKMFGGIVMYDDNLWNWHGEWWETEPR